MQLKFRGFLTCKTVGKTTYVDEKTLEQQEYNLKLRAYVLY